MDLARDVPVPTTARLPDTHVVAQESIPDAAVRLTLPAAARTVFEDELDRKVN
jgi:hypothetical protein